MNIPWEAIVAVLLYLIASTVGFIWWMATQTITLQFVREDLEKANRLLLAFDSSFALKVDVSKEFGRIEASVLAAHKRIDDIKK